MASTRTVRVSSKHQIAIPAAARRELGIEAGDELIVDVRPGTPGHLVIMRRPTTPAEWARGLADVGQEVWRGINGQRYLQAERDAWTDRTDSSPT
jgi:AbrB family looped-hinge helix DNA binding protein